MHNAAQQHMVNGMNRSTRFWSAGFSIFSNELKKEEKARLVPLRDDLKRTADPARRDELKREMAAIKAEFKTKRKNARYSLFAKA